MTNASTERRQYAECHIYTAHLGRTQIKHREDMERSLSLVFSFADTCMEPDQTGLTIIPCLGDQSNVRQLFNFNNLFNVLIYKILKK